MFPRSYDRGLIEALFLRVLLGLMKCLFPRSYDRGLIEARSTIPPFLRISVFPRSYDRGLIEATNLSFPVAGDGGFRGLMIAASLKLRFSRCPGKRRYLVSAVL